MIQGDGEAKMASSARYKHSDTPSHDAPVKFAFVFNSIIFFLNFPETKTSDSLLTAYVLPFNY